ncbi:MAG: transglycosylase SLT domain-containing protein [Candidatus Kaiserbacteria bacterium]|nr:transglycosylase SLT domain-containing protein [Candidatus Kaiserbacteria bacterium]
MKQVFILVMIGVIGGNILKNSEEYNRAHPLVYTAEAQVVEPRVILIEVIPEEKTVEEKIRETFPEDPETALKIAHCESSLDPSAINNRNKNGSVDKGLYQINSVHDKRVRELDLDLFDTDDNLKIARLLYEEHTWSPWVCAKKLGIVQ